METSSKIRYTIFLLEEALIKLNKNSFSRGYSRAWTNNKVQKALDLLKQIQKEDEVC